MAGQENAEKTRRTKKGECEEMKERPIAKQPYRGVIISVKVSVYAADESLATALVKLSLESTIIATLDLSQGFLTNEDAEAYGFEMGQWWIDERRETAPIEQAGTLSK